MKTLSEWLAHCEQLHPHAIDMGLERVRQVAQRMALGLECPVITVAGTNGKGSTCAMLEAIYLQAGYKTGVYTSPHLVNFEERCRLVGESPKAEEFAAAFECVEVARQDTTLTYFEFSTLAILKMMVDAELDVVILEVGLGGRLDAVNVIDPDCAIITSIDLDHTALLGSDRNSIGLEKAGIMRAGKPVVISDPVPPESIVQHAQRLGSDAWLMGKDFNFSGDQLQWSFKCLRRAGRVGSDAPPVARHCTGHTQWFCHGRAGGSFSNCAWRAGFGLRCGSQPPFCGSFGGQPRCHGLLSHHPRRVWGHGRQGFAKHAEEALAAG
jgi:dihydrofolate synthase / folylpolyglutamate synthase